MPSFPIRPIRPDDTNTWPRLRSAHWPDGSPDHPQEIAAFFAAASAAPVPNADPGAVFLAEHDSQPVALLELSIRTNLPTLPVQRIAYIEGLYIVPIFRGSGLVRQLLRFSQSWARQQHCLALATDRAGRLILDPHYRL